MTRSRSRIAYSAAALLAVALLVAGCAQQKPAEVIAIWPQTDTERVIPAPPQPPRWPLTGLVAPTKAATKRRVMSVKIENLPAARPQTGLNSADVVYESVVEGGITRFNLLFQSKIPKFVGPVRSARLSDAWIVPQYHAVFYYSGASAIVTPRLRAQNLQRLPQGSAPAPYYRTSRPAPHNLYMNMSKAWAEAHKHGFKTSVTVPKLEFGPASITTSSTPVKSVYIPFSGFNNVTWTYNKKRDVFLRENNHVVHRDAQTGKQVAAKNVVVLWAKYTQAGLDKHGGMTWDVKLGGTGKAAVFRNGKRYNGKWIASRDEPPHFVDKHGRPIRLEPGNTWFQVVDVGTNITLN